MFIPLILIPCLALQGKPAAANPDVSAVVLSKIRERQDDALRKRASDILGKIDTDRPSSAKLVIAGSELVRAAALPDGTIVLSQNWAKSLDSDAELAGSLALQVAHLKLNHWARLVRSDHPASDEPGNFSENLIRQMVGDSEYLLRATWSDSYETEAARAAAKMLRDAGYDPSAILTPDERALFKGLDYDRRLSIWEREVSEASPVLHRSRVSQFFMPSRAAPDARVVIAGRRLFTHEIATLTDGDLRALAELFDTIPSPSAVVFRSGHIWFRSTILVTEPGPNPQQAVADIRASLFMFEADMRRRPV